MLFTKNVSIQGRRLINTFGKRFLTKSLNNVFSLNKNLKLNKITFPSQILNRNFSTNNNISEKESIELIEAGVFEVLKAAQKLKHEKLNRAASLEELGFDSLDVVELVVAMEEKFGIELSEEDATKINTVLDAIQIFHSYYIKSKVNVGTEIKEKNDTTSLK